MASQRRESIASHWLYGTDTKSLASIMHSIPETGVQRSRASGSGCGWRSPLAYLSSSRRAAQSQQLTKRYATTDLRYPTGKLSVPREVSARTTGSIMVPKSACGDRTPLDTSPSGIVGVRPVLWDERRAKPARSSQRNSAPPFGSPPGRTGCRLRRPAARMPTGSPGLNISIAFRTPADCPQRAARAVPAGRQRAGSQITGYVLPAAHPSTCA